MSWRRHLLWVDCIAGGVVGLGMLLLRDWLVLLYELPPSILVVMALANLLYASFSYSLARRPTRPRRLVKMLAGANVAWGVACLGLLATGPSGVGIALLVFEAIFVAGLGLLEARSLDLLATR
jgi:hypothetical protein